MSHWFSVETHFRSKTAIEKAAAEMGYQIRHRQQCRGYNGQIRECDLVMKLHGGYDLGFNKQPDGSYAVVADFWSDYISQYLADPEVLAKALDQYPNIVQEKGYDEAQQWLANAKMSLFTKKYAYYMVEEIAQSQGLQYTKVPTEDGSIKLELTGESYLQGVF